jgi:hypothetical protein
MRRPAQRVRGIRVSLPQLLVVASVSAVVSALIVISATAQTGPERAVIAGLRERHVIHAPAPAPASRTRAATVAPVDRETPATTPAAPAPSTSDGAVRPPPAATPSTASASSNAPTDSQMPDPANPAPKPGSPVKHVFVIALSTPSYAAALGTDSAATYLNSKLRPRGTVLTNYHTLGAASMPDYIALISGQQPNKDTTAGCPTYDEFRGGAAPNKQGLVPGHGCIYPNTALTIGDQLDSADLPWRAYVEGMTAPCEHPDSGAATTATGDYTPTLNPFVFFHSLLDLGDCQSDDLPYAALAGALPAVRRTPAFSYIAPDACDSGAAACPAGQPQGIAAADAFLKKTVPAILHSAAYRSNGALMVLFTAAPPTAGTTAAGPVRTGALVLSPYTRPGRTLRGSYGPYAVLRTIEDIFGLDALGSSRRAHGFGQDVFADITR